MDIEGIFMQLSNIHLLEERKKEKLKTKAFSQGCGFFQY